MTKIKWVKTADFLIWNRLECLRKNMNLNQTQVSAGSGVSLGTIYHLEAGFDERTSIQTKKRLARFFKCDISDIFPVEMKGNEVLKKEKKEKKSVVKMQFFK